MVTLAANSVFPTNIFDSQDSILNKQVYATMPPGGVWVTLKPTDAPFNLPKLRFLIPSPFSWMCADSSAMTASMLIKGEVYKIKKAYFQKRYFNKECLLTVRLGYIRFLCAVMLNHTNWKQFSEPSYLLRHCQCIVKVLGTDKLDLFCTFLKLTHDRI